MLMKHRLGRLVRASSPTARVLGEWRAATLPRDPAYGDLRACLAAARPGSLAIDVGANVGNYALAMRRSVGRSGTVLALEPHPDVYAELASSTWRSGVRCLQVAASDQTGTATLTIPLAGDGDDEAQLSSLAASGREGATRTVEVECVTLDGLVRTQFPSADVSVIKIDVEGHEDAVVRGAAELIRAHRPTLVVEIEQRHLGDRTVSSVVESVVAMDYECHALGRDATVSWADYDVDRDQLDHLSADRRSILPGHEERYLNNFVFSPR